MFDNNPIHEHRSYKPLLIVIASLLIGAVIGGSIVFFGFRHLVISSTIFTEPPVITDSQAEDFDLPAPDQNEVDDTETTILLSKAAVTRDYHESMNSLLEIQKDIAAQTRTDIVPLMVELKRQSMEGSYEGFFDLVFEAKTAIREVEQKVNAFEEELDRLRTISDESELAPSIKEKTASFAADGRELVTTYREYFAALDATLTGGIPTVDTIERIDAAVADLNEQSDIVSTSLNELLQDINSDVTVPEDAQDTSQEPQETP